MKTREGTRPVRLGLSRMALLLLGSLYLFNTATAQIPPHDKQPCKAGSKQAGCQDKAPGEMTSPQAESGGRPAATSFPFPTEDSRRGGESTTNQPVPLQNNLPAMPTTGVPDPPSSSERPISLPPDASGDSSGRDDASGGSSSSHAAEDDDVAPTAAPSDAPIKSSALKDLGSRGDTSAARLKLEQTRVADDLKVGGFYMKDGNVQGAYLRFKDAADRDPEDPDIRFNLAVASARLNKRDEAMLNYREYLRLDPGGDHDKVSRKALSKLEAAPGK